MSRRVINESLPGLKYSQKLMSLLRLRAVNKSLKDHVLLVLREFFHLNLDMRAGWALGVGRWALGVGRIVLLFSVIVNIFASFLVNFCENYSINK